MRKCRLFCLGSLESRAYQRCLTGSSCPLTAAVFGDAAFLLTACAGRTDVVFLCFDLVPGEATSLMTRRRWPATIFGFIPEFHCFKSCAVTARSEEHTSELQSQSNL